MYSVMYQFPLILAYLLAVPISVIASFRKMKKLIRNNSLIATALKDSSLLVIFLFSSLVEYLCQWDLNILNDKCKSAFL